MKATRFALSLLLLGWVVVVVYPNPFVLSASITNFEHPNVDPAAVAALARTLPNNPQLIEQAVLNRIVPYSYDWQTYGVPWYFPTTKQTLAAGKGNCQGRALVLASILKAKGIPYQIEMSFDHMWVNYPGHVSTALENNGAVLGRRVHGHYVLQWPKNFHIWSEVKAQIGQYWTPMPPLQKALILVGAFLIPLWNGLARLVGRLMGAPVPLPKLKLRRRWVFGRVAVAARRV
jgi:transglutaminase-like putative cysteine protease